jgi:hypothetical protein
MPDGGFCPCRDKQIEKKGIENIKKDAVLLFMGMIICMVNILKTMRRPVKNVETPNLGVSTINSFED